MIISYDFKNRIVQYFTIDKRGNKELVSQRNLENSELNFVTAAYDEVKVMRALKDGLNDYE